VLTVARAKHSLRVPEVAVSVLADHRCINKCIGHANYLCMDTQVVFQFLVMERMQMSLYAHGVQRRTPHRPVALFKDFMLADVTMVITCLVEALDYLHTELIVEHLDIHEGNVLVNHGDDGRLTQVCLADMGRARPYKVGNFNPGYELHTSANRLPQYPPECYDNLNVGSHSDVYGSTVLCLHVMCGTRIWKDYFGNNRDFTVDIDVESMLGLRRSVMIPHAKAPCYVTRKAMRRLSRVVNGDGSARQKITIQHAKGDVLTIAKEWHRR
jgi:serine/threonine protein kinase